MKKGFIIIFVIALIAVISLLYYFLIYVPSQNIPKEGAPCKAGILPGTIRNGKCIVNTLIEDQLPSKR